MTQSEYKVKEYTFEYKKTSTAMIYDIDESNAFVDGSSYIDTTDKKRLPANYNTATYCYITYIDGTTKIYFWSTLAGTVHAFIRYK